MTWLSDLPEQPSPQRDKITLDAVASGLAIVEWSDISSTYQNHTATFRVSTDAAYVNTEQGRFRPQFTASMAQQAADLVGGMLPTTKAMDLRHLASNKLNATLLSAGPQMSSTSYSKKWNANLELKRKDYSGIVSDAGKPWLVDNRLAQSAGAVLYGFYDVNAPSTNSIGLKMWQLLGTKHNKMHQDYSSTLILLAKNCIVDGQNTTVEEVVKDPILSHLINYDGILNYVRQP